MKKNLVFTLLVIIGLVGCNNARESIDLSYASGVSKSKVSIEEALDAEVNFEDGNMQETGADVKIEQKLIKTGDLRFETVDLQESRALLDKLIAKNKAYVSSESAYKNTTNRGERITIRIPAKNFDSFIDELSIGVKYFDRKSINIEDVSTEYIDVETRLKTKKELEARYLTLLNKATKVSEIIEIEREIGALRADIESFEGRLKYLKDAVGFSTLEIEYYKVEQENGKFWNSIVQAVQQGWASLLLFIIGVVSLWPIIPLVILILFLWKKFKVWRNRSSK